MYRNALLSSMGVYMCAHWIHGISTLTQHFISTVPTAYFPEGSFQKLRRMALTLKIISGKRITDAECVHIYTYLFCKLPGELQNEVAVCKHDDQWWDCINKLNTKGLQSICWGYINESVCPKAGWHFFSCFYSRYSLYGVLALAPRLTRIETLSELRSKLRSESFLSPPLTYLGKVYSNPQLFPCETTAVCN